MSLRLSAVYRLASPVRLNLNRLALTQRGARLLETPIGEHEQPC